MKILTSHSKKQIGMVIFLIAILLVLTTLPTSIAAADEAYHTDYIQLQPVGDAPLREGFVNNIHPNGSQVYAHEIYELKGAQPYTTYNIFLMVYPFDTQCSAGAARIPTATLVTNEDGNGVGQFFLPPEGVPADWRSNTHGVRWEIKLDNSLVYDTACTAVALD